MHTVVVLSFIAVVSAGRLGYDYQLGAAGSSGLTASESGSISNYGIASEGSGNSGLRTGSDRGLSGYPALDVPVVSSGLNKEFYLYSAPEEEFHDGDATQRVASSLKKNLRVVFIKAPENNGLTNAALQLAKQANDDRTAIYVLSKQPDISELANQIQDFRESVKQKPEVRFIKYRTPEDAINAQRTIQQQYDALGGSTHSSNEGIAPVINFASAARESGHRIVSGGDVAGSTAASNVSPIGLIGGSTQREYLPPIVY